MDPITIISVLVLIVPLAMKTYNFIEQKINASKQRASQELSQVDDVEETEVEQVKSKIENEKDISKNDTNEIIGEINDVLDTVGTLTTSPVVREGAKKISNMGNEIISIQQEKAVEKQQEQMTHLSQNQKAIDNNNHVVNSVKHVDSNPTYSKLSSQEMFMMDQVLSQPQIQSIIFTACLLKQHGIEPTMQNILLANTMVSSLSQNLNHYVEHSTSLVSQSYSEGENDVMLAGHTHHHAFEVSANA